jgi:hypothetical protein
MIVSSRTPRKRPDRSEVVYRYSGGRTFYDPRASGGAYTVTSTDFLAQESMRAGLSEDRLLQEDGDKIRLET